ncbi:MAG: ketoacyl-ACP synthase III [Kofleriaceae bacterium]|nr:ketoacyl-ACP synthase III [Myxococcales bacterium]MCB9570916.1 ketoacyl-ACP synthase III [Kofleriaceae bacterium]
MPGITIIGTGRYVPGEPVSNDALARVMDTDDAWIKQRTGIAQRHFADEGVGASDLAVEASRRAIAAAGLEPRDIDYIVFATMTPDFAFPGPGGLLGAKLGIPGVPALDIRQQCAAMPFAFQVADGLVASGAAETILVVGAEAHAGFMPWRDWDVVTGASDAEVSEEDRERATRHRGLAVIFGDGAGALVLRKHATAGHGLIGALLHSDGGGANLIYIDGGGFRRRPHWAPWMVEQDMHIPRMAGRELFKNAVTKLPQVVRELCERHGVALDDVDWFLAHQANDRINDAVRNALKIPAEKVPSNIARYGNTSGATIPILLDELTREGRVKPGQLVCFLALGAGLHWGAALMRL